MHSTINLYFVQSNTATYHIKVTKIPKKSGKSISMTVIYYALLSNRIGHA